MKLYNVRIIYAPGLGGPAILVHRTRSAWSRRQAQRHAANIRAGRTGVKDFIRVEIVEA